VCCRTRCCHQNSAAHEMAVAAVTTSHPTRCMRIGCCAPCRSRRVTGRADPGNTNGGSTADPSEAPDEAARWTQIDDRIRSELLADEVQETLPLPFLATVSSFGTALTGYLTWSKLTNNHVVCPLSGCTSILSSPYAQIGPVPLSALGLLGYATVASLCFCSIALKSQRSDDVLQESVWLTRTQQGILYGTFSIGDGGPGRIYIIGCCCTKLPNWLPMLTPTPQHVVHQAQSTSRDLLKLLMYRRFVNSCWYQYRSGRDPED